MKTFSTLLQLAAFSLTISNFSAQQSVLVLNSSTDTVYKLDAVTGAVVNANFISLPSGTSKGIAQVNDKIWIADQIADDIYIYNFDGSPHSTLLGDVVGLDNIRGLNVVNNEVWVTNAGSNNGATANSIRRLSMTGAPLGYYTTVTSPFDVVDNGSAAFVSSFSSPSEIQILGYDGTVMGSLLPGPVLANIEQMNFNSEGNLVVATFANHSASGNNRGIYVINPTTGAILNSWPTPGSSGNAGVLQLGNGNYLYSNGAGLHILDPTTGTHSSIYTSGAFQYMAKINESPLSVREAQNQDFKVYPNPAADILYVTAKQKIKHINIFSAEGRLVSRIEGSADSMEIPVTSMTPGVYFIEIHTGNQVKSSKFIKK
ncbi:T9SS type A sorting domain-containing protein [Marnyiella aurantia]|uniref:T9SS type A sorting domain-containing protein n=1 Tax=Marnyiella aurantia TaxID=2758037 RepID=A0A7D7QFV7_9FLAO|nr:T9SS type A sorting domain-containing protein [Marnyiella aurantia]MBA5247488.1 T9SS type A sorting domain-containing protein [Marnyiella aurantia]QMS99243.1 T9SS type A sorting domain-containing protein [Marnyiella aurantia]